MFNVVSSERLKRNYLLEIMEKRKSMSIRLDRHSRRGSKSSGGSGVLNPDTNNLGDEYPYWWRNLENTTIARLSTDSTNFNQTSRRLNSNSSINENDLKDGWWKVLEDTPADSKSHQRNNGISEKGTTISTPVMSESDEEGMVKKMRPPLRHVVRKAKKSIENPFLDVLKNASDSKLSTTSLKRKLLKKKRFSTTADSSVIAAPTDLNKVQNSLTEYEHDLTTNSLPKASSTLLESSNLSRQDSQGNSNSDTEYIVMKPKSKLLRRHNIEMKKEEKNLFEDVLFRNTIDKDTDRTIHNISTEVYEAIEKPELQTTHRCKPVDANAKDSFETSGSSATTIHPTFQGLKPKSKFLRGSQRNPRKNIIQNILDDSDSSTTIIISNRSEHEKNQSNKNVRFSGRSRVISTESTSHSEEVHLRLSNSSDLTDTNVTRTSTKKIFSSQNNDDVVPSSQPPVASDRISAGLHLKSVLPKEVEKGRMTHSVVDDSDENASTGIRSQEFDSRGSQSIPRNSRKPSDVTQTITSNSQKIANEGNVACEIAPEESAIESRIARATKSQRQLISATIDDEKAVQDEEASLRRSKSPSRLQGKSISHDRSASKAEQSIETPSRRQTRHSALVQERNSTPVNDKINDKVSTITPRRSKRSWTPQISSELQESVSRVKSVTEAEHSTGTLSQRQGKHSAAVKKRISTAVDDEKIREMKNIVGRRILKVSLTRIVIDPKTAATGSPMKQSNHVSESQPHVLKSIKENELVEVNNVTPRRSQRVSRNQEDVPTTKGRQSQVKDSQSRARQQRKRTSKVRKHHLSPVTDDKLTIAEDIASPSQRPSATGKRVALAIADESVVKDSQSHKKRQSKRKSKAKELVTPNPVEVNKVLSTSQNQRSSIFPSQVDGIEYESILPPTESWRRESETTESEGAESPSNKQSKLVGNTGEKTVPIAATAKGTKEAEDTGQRRSQDDLERQRKARSMMSFFSYSDSETENEPREAEDIGQKQSPKALKRKNKPGRVTLSDSKTENVEPSTPMRSKRITKKQTVANAVTENEPSKVEDVGQKQSPRALKRKNKSGRVTLSDSKTENVEPSTSTRSKSITKKQTVANAVTENEPSKVEDVGQKQSPRALKRKNKPGRVTLSDSKTENVEPSTSTRSKSITKKQTVANAVAENEPSKVEDVGQKQSPRALKRKNKPGRVTLSDSKTENVEPSTSTRSKSITKKQTVANAVAENEPSKVEDVGQKQSPRALKRKNKPGRVTLSDSKTENVEPSTSTRSKSITKKQTVANAVAENEPSKVEDVGQKQSPRVLKRKNKPGRVTLSDSKTENVEPSTSTRSKSITKKQTVTNAVAENEPSKVEDVGQKQSPRALKRKNKPGRVTLSDSKTENVEPSTSTRSKSITKKQTVANAVAENEPSKVEDVGQKQSPRALKRKNKPGRVTLSDSKTENVEPSTSTRSKSITKKQTVANAVAENEPSETEDTERRRSRGNSGRQRNTHSVVPSFATSDTETENDRRGAADTDQKESPGVLKRKSKSISKRQTVANAATENESPMAAEVATQKQSREDSKRQSNPQGVISSLEVNDSKTENAESPTKKRHERASEKQTIAIAGTSGEPVEAEESVRIRSREKRRQSEFRRITSLLSTSDSDLESIESPNRGKSKSSINAKPTSAEKRRSKKRSSFRKSSKLVFATTFDSEDSVKPRKISQNLHQRQSSLRKSDSFFSEDERIDVADHSMETLRLTPKDKEIFPFGTSTQNRSKSYAQKETSLLNSTFSAAENSFVRTIMESPKLDQSRNDVNSQVEKSSTLSISQVEPVSDKLSEGRTLVATTESVSTPNKRSRVVIRSIETSKIGNLNASTRKIGDDRSRKRSSSRAIIDRNREPVESLTEQNEPGTSRVSGRSFLSSRVHNESDHEQLRRIGLSNVGNKAKSSLTTSGVAKIQQHMEDFFKVKTSATTVLSNVETAQEIRKKLDEMKEQVIAEVKTIFIDNGPKLSGSRKKKDVKVARSKKPTSAQIQVQKAFLVNGKVYKQPRLPRPMKWVTDRLYHFLWKRMQPKFEQQTRAQSEKFVRRLCEVSTLIMRRKSYVSYKVEMYALMKEMARLQLIRTRHDFYNFCYDYLPYELRIKMVPMLLPGNQRNIPYEPDKLYEPLLDS